MGAPDIVAARVARMIPQHQHRRNRMTLPTNDEFANCELSIEELETIAAGGSWSHLKHIASDVGIVAGKIGLGVAIGLGIFGGVSFVLGGPATSRNPNVN
jgi:hypothetical protein